MELLHFDDTGPYAAPALVVMLPGAYSAPQEFVDEGFVSSLRQQGAHADVVLAGATLDHYIEGPVLELLRDEVVAPARARGVQQVWLVGISLGGLFAMAYAARNPGHVSGGSCASARAANWNIRPRAAIVVGTSCTSRT